VSTVRVSCSCDAHGGAWPHASQDFKVQTPTHALLWPCGLSATDLRAAMLPSMSAAGAVVLRLKSFL